MVDLIKGLIAFGVGATTFLGVTVVVIEALGGAFPSAIVALPVGLLTGVTVSVGAGLTLGAHLGRPVQSGAAGVAAFAYALGALWLLRYSVAAVRPTLSIPAIVLASAFTAVVVAAVAWNSYPIIRSDALINLR